MKYIEELLKPRYKVTLSYPGSPFELNAILALKHNKIQTKFFEYEWAEHDGVKRESEIFFQDFPHLFKKLDWWEDRTIDEMLSVDYIKIVISPGYWLVGDILPVEEWCVRGKKFVGYLSRISSGAISPAYVVPATKEEYLEFKKNK